MNEFAPLKTEGTFEFWVNGIATPITGKITQFEFVEVDNEVTTFLNIASGTKMYRFPLKQVNVWAEQDGAKAA